MHVDLLTRYSLGQSDHFLTLILDSFFASGFFSWAGEAAAAGAAPSDSRLVFLASFFFWALLNPSVDSSAAAALGAGDSIASAFRFLFSVAAGAALGLAAALGAGSVISVIFLLLSAGS